MEDEFQVAYQRTHDKKDIEYAFFGIFDGHGGKEAAHFAKDNLMDNIVSLRTFWSDDDEDVLAAIKEGFLQTHMAMWKVLGEWRENEVLTVSIPTRGERRPSCVFLVHFSFLVIHCK